MARSDERAAVLEPVRVTIYDRYNGVMLELDNVRKQLAAQGLHVVTDAEMRVLKAMSAFTLVGLKWMRQQWEIPERIELEAAELARREGK